MLMNGLYGFQYQFWWFMRYFVSFLLLLCVSSCAQSKQYCFGEPNKNEYADVVMCINLGTQNHFELTDTNGKTDITEQWPLSGFAWNRIGGFVPLSGSVITGFDQDGTPSYFISYDANLVQKAQKTPEFGIAMYAVKGNMILKKDRIGVIAPGDISRYNPEWVIGVSYREDIMVNASLFGLPCQDKPWLCWDLQDGKTPKPVVRYALDNLPFLKPQAGGY
jgi:hypothetical protein